MNEGFIMIELNDGGADYIEYAYPEVIIHLEGNEHWKQDLEYFKAQTWKPGDWMHFSNGWIFCVNEEGGPDDDAG